MKISMKLLKAGVTDHETLQWMKSAGFDGVDFSFCELWKEPEKFLSEEHRQELLQTARWIHKEGLTICQCHLPYLPGHIVPEDASYETYEAQFLPMYRRCLEICGEIGCPVAVIHLYFEEDARATFENNLRLMKLLLPDLEKNGVTLAIENIYGGGSAYANCHVSYPEDILRYVEEMNHPNIGICLDTGHANVLHCNAVEMARQYGRHVVATHIHGNTGEDEHFIPGLVQSWSDSTDYRELVAVLRQNGYAGSFNLELVLPPLPKNARKTFIQLAYETAYGFLKEETQ